MQNKLLTAVSEMSNTYFLTRTVEDTKSIFTNDALNVFLTSGISERVSGHTGLCTAVFNLTVLSVAGIMQC